MHQMRISTSCWGRKSWKSKKEIVKTVQEPKKPNAALKLNQIRQMIELCMRDNPLLWDEFLKFKQFLTLLGPRLWRVPYSNHSVCPSVCLSVRPSKTLTLVITFDWYVLGLSYFTCIFLMVRPFIWYHDLDPLTFDLGVLSKKRGILLCTCRSVGMSVGRPDDVRLISWEPFVRLLWYFICGLVMRRGRPLLILRSIGQRSRSFTLEIGIFCLLNIVRTLCLTDFTGTS